MSVLTTLLPVAAKRLMTAGDFARLPDTRG
jgi:hypothetical protein